MSDPTRALAPAPLKAAASLAALQGLVLIGLGLLELAAWDSDRVVMNLTTTVSFLGFGAAMLWCTFNLLRGRSWARSPIVFAQLIQLGLAWSFREALLVAIMLLVTAVVTLAGVLHPDSLDYLADEDPTTA